MCSKCLCKEAKPNCCVCCDKLFEFLTNGALAPSPQTLANWLLDAGVLVSKICEA